MHVSRLADHPLLPRLAPWRPAARTSPAPPVVTPPAGTETINGTERIGWDQRAADTAELAAISYVLYVDGTRTPLTAVTCATQASAAGFACSARLPALSAGSHTLQLASFVTDGTVLESERSASLSVSVVPQTSAALRAARHAGEGAVAAGLGRVARRDRRTASTLRVELVADGLRRTDRSRVRAGWPAARRRARGHDSHPASSPDLSGRHGASCPDPALSLADDVRHGEAIDPRARARPAVRAHAVRVRDLRGAVAVGRTDVHAGPLP